MTRMAFTADLHADDYASIPGRFDDILRTVRWVARTALEREAQVLVVAGDYTESKAPVKAGRVVAIAGALADGPRAQIHVRGNHDVEFRGASIVDDLARTPGWHGYAKPGLELVNDVAICAIPFLDRAWWRAQPGNEHKPDSVAFEELRELYQVYAAGLYAQAVEAGAGAAVLVGHQQLAGGQMNDSQAIFLGAQDLVVDARALTAIGYSAVVFGHVHRAQTVIDDPSCPVLYAGSIERVDFAEEHEEKSFVLLDVEPGRPVSIERVPTPARRYLTLTADSAVGRDAIEGSIVRVLGAGEPPADIQRALEAAGAFAVTEIRELRPEAEAPRNAISEALTAEQALDEYFAGDPDREALVDLGRGILAEVG